MKNLTKTIALVLCATGVQAQQGCPTDADLGRGITLHFGDGASETYTAVADATTQVDGKFNGALSYRLLIAQGTHLLSYVEVVDGAEDPASQQVYDYGLAPSQLPVPVAGERFNANVTVAASDGARQEPQLQAYVEGPELVVGTCRYATIDALIAYDTENNYMETIRYIPELALGFMLWNQSDQDARLPDTTIIELTVAP